MMKTTYQSSVKFLVKIKMNIFVS
ncbi:hypothetical protein BpHYR1_039867 [Brachionus plicatilis]|uniref:Uncharacterized protein n=1 Tax=Brachionus plicatilis TaxID=10195 RepID=A0A3M7RKH4_BRAPC|nr:hypothetical protein BpHYR1_039867 [Brachionus plicatilis]